MLIVTVLGQGVGIVWYLHIDSKLSELRSLSQERDLGKRP
jgi:hypothetical protein